MRRKTRQIHVGDLAIGGDAPIVVQSMTTTYTRDVESTVAQIYRLEDVGCEMVRVAVPEMEDAQAIGEIKKRIHIPLVADIHYKHALALEAIRQGIDCVRVNPGNLINGRKSLEEIVALCKERGIAMRIGVNSGSIDALDQRGQMQRIQVRLRDDGVLERSDPADPGHDRPRDTAAPAPGLRQRWGLAAAVAGQLHLRSEQRLEPSEIASLGGGEEPPCQLLALLAGALEARPALRDVASGPGGELAHVFVALADDRRDLPVGVVEHVVQE